MKTLWRVVAVAMLLLLSHPVRAQYNIKKMMEEGRNMLAAGYYVVSMQIFSRVVGLKPNMHEAWFLLGKSKYYLEDYEGAELDSSEAIRLNPYIAEMYDLRGMSRIREERFDSAAVDYTRALEIAPDNRTYWYNRAYCYYCAGQTEIAASQLEYLLRRWPEFRQARELQQELGSSHPTKRSGKPVDLSKKKNVLKRLWIQTK